MEQPSPQFSDSESVLSFLHQFIISDTSFLPAENKLWITLTIAFLLMIGMLVFLIKMEKIFKMEEVNAFVYKVQDEKKLLNEIHICSTLSHDVANVNRCVSLLMESPGAINICREPFGFTPFLNACWSGCKPLVRFMLLNGAKVERKTRDGDSALMLAVRSQLEAEVPDLQLLTILLQAGCDVNDSNCNGYTPLHLASSFGNLVICEWLVNNGADPLLKTSASCTAQQLAQKDGHQPVVQFLASHGKKKSKRSA